MNSNKKGDMQFLKRNSLMGDELLNFDPSELEDDDWNVFDDDAPTDSLDPGSSDKTQQKEANNNNNNGTSSSSNATTSSTTENTTSASTTGEAPTSATGVEASFKNALSNLESIKEEETNDAQIKNTESGLAKAPWHNEATDLPHRKAMVQEIAQLLFARKKDNPGKKWLERLPVKARMLETQLYKSASSLEAYLNRRTLKSRLGKLASAITSHFKDAVRKGRGSSSSIRSVPDSFGTTTTFDSLSTSDKTDRRSSTGGLPAGPPITSLRREQSESAVANKSVPMPGPPVAKLRREQSEPVVRSSMQNTAMNAPNKVVSTAGGQPNNNSSLPFNGNNMQAMFQQGGNDGQMQQQQFFSNMRQQQQQNIVNQMNPQGLNNNQFMAAQAAMMGGPNGMVMMNQLQQQQNAMNMNNLMQQQQNRQGGMNMQNMMAFQQQQQLQQQQQQQNMGGGMFMNGNIPNDNMNMMNFSLPNVIPGAMPNNSNNNCNFQQVNNNPLMTRDNMSMPPPMNANTPGRKSSGNDEGSSLSPNSFNW